MEMKLLLGIAAVLERSATPYALIGAGALASHGVARSTVDWDLLVVDRTCLEPGRWAALAAAGVEVVPTTGDFSDPLAGVVRFEEAGEGPVDLIIGKSAWQREILERATPLSLAGHRLPVVRAADLILLKLYAGGPQDAWDIAQLLSGRQDGALEAEVERDLPKLPDRCHALWQRLSRETT